ncbi:PilN domain-containing protein [bacterium]|nr:PilN domain-containing protein [bacterium]MBU1782477.1 PilN domain-containing protein [bacterium]MBU2599970.1 PilN domain-containing protein [bacterium]
MTKINLLINKLIEIRRKRRIVIFVATTAVVILSFMLGIFLEKWWQYQGLRQELTSLEGQFLEIEEVVVQVETLKKEKELMKKRIDIIKALLKTQMLWTRILEEVNQSIPAGLWLRNFGFQEEGKVELKGSSLGNYPIVNLMINLKKFPLFKEVSLKSIEKTSKGKERIQNFHLEFKVGG